MNNLIRNFNFRKVKNTSRIINITITALICTTISCSAQKTIRNEKPNIVIFYLDDMGWGQPGCYGGKLAPTPNIDALAISGVRFTNGYVSAAICSPSRVGLMTGRYQAHTGHDALTTKPGTELDINEVTMAQRLKAVGYKTGIVGKWHLGDTRGYLPISRGFDYSYGSVSNVNEGEKGKRFYRGNELVGDPEGYPDTAPIYLEESLKFIEANKKSPWFLYLPLNAVHAPSCASKEFLKKFAYLNVNNTKSEVAKQTYAAMIAEADDLIGQVMKKINDNKQRENTIVFLISDNGGASPFAEMGGLRGRKWLVWEGGVRVSWIASWPAQVKGGQVCDVPVIQLDVLPTLLAASGNEVKPEWNLDGVNILPLMQGKVVKLESRSLYWRFCAQNAIRKGDLKVVKAAIDMNPMLVDLSKDLGEETDLSTQLPDVFSTMQDEWATWNAGMQPPRWYDRRSEGEEAMKKLLLERKAK